MASAIDQAWWRGWTRLGLGGAGRALLLGAYLQVAWVKAGRAEDRLSVKWQDYQEDDGRVRVLSKYVGVEKRINASWALRAHGVHDAISGATPTGSTGDSGDELVLGEVTDRRDAGVVDLDWEKGGKAFSLQYAHSKESDFLSKGYAVYGSSEYNKRNTTLRYGASRVDDAVEPSFFDAAREKESWDGYVGASQNLDRNTVVGLNFTYSRFSGYLDDPYKVIRKDVEVIPGFFLTQEFAERRPRERERRIWFANARRYFEGARASLDVDARYFNDTWGIESWTVDVEWYQKFGDKVVLRPSYRFYQQGSANFYYADLDGTGIDPTAGGPLVGPYYSADYRLAAFRSETWGLKAVVEISEAVSLDASYERYRMEGREEGTPAGAFPAASIVTVGGVWRF